MTEPPPTVRASQYSFRCITLTLFHQMFELLFHCSYPVLALCPSSFLAPCVAPQTLRTSGSRFSSHSMGWGWASLGLVWPLPLEACGTGQQAPGWGDQLPGLPGTEGRGDQDQGFLVLMSGTSRTSWSSYTGPGREMWAYFFFKNPHPRMCPLTLEREEGERGRGALM